MAPTGTSNLTIMLPHWLLVAGRRKGQTKPSYYRYPPSPPVIPSVLSLRVLPRCVAKWKWGAGTNSRLRRRKPKDNIPNIKHHAVVLLDYEDKANACFSRYCRRKRLWVCCYNSKVSYWSEMERQCCELQLGEQQALAALVQTFQSSTFESTHISQRVNCAYCTITNDHPYETTTQELTALAPKPILHLWPMEGETIMSDADRHG